MPKLSEIMYPARMNPNLAAQGRNYLANMIPPESVMDPRYAAWKKAQDNAETVGVFGDLALSAIPMAGPVMQGVKAAGRFAGPELAHGLENYMGRTGMQLNAVPELSTKSAIPDSSKNIISGIGDDLVTLYHGTSKSSAAKIRNEGVIKSGSYFGNINGVALTPRKSVAEDFANGGEIIEVKVPKSKLVVDPESVDDMDLDQALRNGNSLFAIGNVLLK